MNTGATIAMAIRYGIARGIFDRTSVERYRAERGSGRGDVADRRLHHRRPRHRARPHPRRVILLEYRRLHRLLRFGGLVHPLARPAGRGFPPRRLLPRASAPRRGWSHRQRTWSTPCAASWHQPA